MGVFNISTSTITQHTAKPLCKPVRRDLRSASSSNLMQVLLVVKVDSLNLVPHDPFVVCSWSKLSLIFWSPCLCFIASYYSPPFQPGLTYTSLK